MSNAKTYPVLSIDAWADSDGGWSWNEWHNAGTIDLDIDSTPEEVMAAMAEAGFVKNPHLGDVEDDQHNLVLVDRETRRPIFAIDYGTSPNQ